MKHLTKRCCRTNFPLRSKFAAERGVSCQKVNMDKTTKMVAIFLLTIGSFSLISNSVWEPFMKKESMKISDAQLQDVVNQIN